MEGYITESVKQFVEVIRGEWKVLIIPAILATYAVFVIQSNNKDSTMHLEGIFYCYS